jgi:hypothetical protein
MSESCSDSEWFAFMPASWGSGLAANWSAFEKLIADSQKVESWRTWRPGVGLMEHVGRTQSHAATVIINGMPGADPGSD